MSAVTYEGTTSIHPNGRNFSKPYKAAGNGKRRRKAMARLNARRNAFSTTKNNTGQKMPGSMAR